MLSSIQNNFHLVIPYTKSYEPIIFICLLILILLIGRSINGRRKAKKEEETATPSRKKNRKKFKSCYDSATILGLETDNTTTNPSPKHDNPTRQTLAHALGFTSEHNSEPGPNNGMTIGEVLGPLRGDKRSRKWMLTVIRAVARISCRDPTAEGGSNPLIKETDHSEERRKTKKRARRERRGRDEGLGMCHVCRQRSKNATLVPCGHAYCRVCSREIWINARCCPICSTQIVEVLDTF